MYAAQSGTKKFAPGKRRVSIEDKGNKLAVNGTGGVLVVDVDTKNGGSVEELSRAFPGIAEQETVTVSTPSGGVRLVYSLNEYQDWNTRTRTSTFELVKGVEVPPQYLVPGSIVRLEDGSRHTYTIGEVVVPAQCPPDLWAVVADDGDDVEITRPPVDLGGSADHWLSQWANSGAGEHNDAFKACAWRVFHALGVEDGIRALEENDPGWDNLKYAIPSAVKAFEERDVSSESTFTVCTPSRTRRVVLDMLKYNAVLGQWSGKGAANDRRVFLQLLERVEACSELVVEYKVETLATHTGIKPDSVRVSLERLEEQGRITRSFPDNPHRINLTSSVLGCYSLFKYLYPPRDIDVDSSFNFKSTIHPLSELWRCDGLTGRHSHLFSLIDNGVSTHTDLVKRSGASKATVSDCVKQLIATGLITKSEEGLSVASVVDDEFVHRLCMERGGYQATSGVSDRIRNSHERLEAWKAEQERKNIENYRRAMERPHEEEELHRQLGLEG